MRHCSIFINTLLQSDTPFPPLAVVANVHRHAVFVECCCYMQM